MVAVNMIDPAGPGPLGIGAETGQNSGSPSSSTGESTQDSFITPLGETGTINVKTWAATDLTIDMIGYFNAPTRAYHYNYDATGLRTAEDPRRQRTQRGRAGPRSTPGTRCGGLLKLLAEHHAAGTSYLVYGPGNTPIYQITKTGDVMYYHQDHLGSTRLTTNANGTTRNTISYNAHGEITANTNWWLQEQPLLGYNSQYHDPETGYIYLRARHYDPTTSQFTTVDPLVAVTEEPYGYAGGDPANHWDPWGLDHCPPGNREMGV